jgi:hypothetical protein
MFIPPTRLFLSLPFVSMLLSLANPASRNAPVFWIRHYPPFLRFHHIYVYIYHALCVACDPCYLVGLFLLSPSFYSLFGSWEWRFGRRRWTGLFTRNDCKELYHHVYFFSLSSFFLFLFGFSPPQFILTLNIGARLAGAVDTVARLNEI